MYDKIAAFLLIILTSYTINAAVKSRVEPVIVRATTVNTAELFEVYSTIGQCKIDQSREYYANVGGTLEAITAKQGDKVLKGEILAIIDKDIALSTKKQAESAYKTALDSNSRYQSLFTKNIISYEVLQKSQTDLEKAKYSFIKEMKTYNDMFITAPFDSEIGVVKARIGEKIKPGDYLFSLIEKGGSQSILISLPENLYGKVTTNTEANILKNKNSKIAGKIISISQYLSDNGTISARISIDAKDKVLHGSYVSVELIINKHSSLAIPEQCIQRNNHGNFIYKIDENNIVKLVYVTIGNRANNLIAINSQDIKEGDKIVLEGLTKVAEGQAVTLM